MAGFLKNFVTRKVSGELKGALPLASGDSFLLGVIGNVISKPGRSAELFKEGEVFLIKSAVYLSGVRIEPSGYDGVGDIYKEQAGIYQFDPNLGKGDGRPLPFELSLPHGLHVPLVVNEASPFSLVREKGTLYLRVNNLKLMPVEYEPRPRFYSKKTADGVEMVKLAQHRLSDELMVTYNTYCRFIKGGKQCRFCSLSPHEASYRGHNGFFIQTPSQIAEIAEAAYSEGICKGLELTGGVLPNRADVDFALNVGKAVTERLGVGTIPGGHAVIAPPDSFSQIDELKDAGWESVFFNIEIWEPNLFAGLCPGKNELIGWKKWVDSLEYAVGVFGRGKVGSVLIAGLEPLQSYLEGIEVLTRMGVHVSPIPWTPMPGSLLEGHTTPTAQWHINLAVKTLDIWEKYGRSTEEVATEGWYHFNDLARMRLKLRQIQESQPDYPIKDDLRYKLAVLGQLDI